MFPVITLLEGTVGAYILLGSSSIGYIMLRTGWPRFRSLETEYKAGWGIITGSLFAVSTLGLAFAGTLVFPGKISPIELLFVTPTCTVVSGIIVFSLKRKFIGGKKVKVSVPKRVIAASIIAKKAFNKLPEKSFVLDSEIPQMPMPEQVPAGIVIETRESLSEKEKYEKKMTDVVAKPVMAKPEKQPLPVKKEFVKLNPALELPAPRPEISGVSSVAKSQEQMPAEKPPAPKAEEKTGSGLFSMFGFGKHTAKPAVQKPTTEPQKEHIETEKISQDRIMQIKRKLVVMQAQQPQIPGQKKQQEFTSLKGELRSDVSNAGQRRAMEVLSALDKKKQNQSVLTNREMSEEVEDSKKFILENLREKLGMKSVPKTEETKTGHVLPKSAKVLRQILQSSKVGA